MFVDGRDEQGMQGLAHLDIHLPTQRQCHRRDVLRDLHPFLQLLIDHRLVAHGEVRQMHRFGALASRHGDQVAIETISIERCDGGHQLGHCLQTGVERLISRQLIGCHAATPETSAIEPHVPVAQVVVNKVRYGTACAGRIVRIQITVHVLDERVEQRQDPTINLRVIGHRHVWLAVGEAVDVGVEGEEGVRIV